MSDPVGLALGLANQAFVILGDDPEKGFDLVRVEAAKSGSELMALDVQGGHAHGLLLLANSREGRFSPPGRKSAIGP
jgi:hypothetical protein